MHVKTPSFSLLEIPYANACSKIDLGYFSYKYAIDSPKVGETIGRSARV